uniref:Uncharacterized protein n=1 Tax=Anguilla anguilla TaxID=7936 RepID=A0A0E9RYW4_ANGAN
MMVTGWMKRSMRRSLFHTALIGLSRFCWTGPCVIFINGNSISGGGGWLVRA